MAVLTQLDVRDVADAFDEFRDAISATATDRRLARRRVRVVRRALKRDRCVRAVYTSGSFARRTQCHPLHDVDLIAVFGHRTRPDWDPRDPESAGRALAEVQAMLERHLRNGPDVGRITKIEPRNRVVRCFLEVTEQEGNPRSFAIEIMPSLWAWELAPGLRHTSRLRAPGARQRTWITTNPLYLRFRFAVRNWCWWHFPSLGRMLRAWREHHFSEANCTKLGIQRPKSLVMDVLALHYIPRRFRHPLLTRQRALAAFFASAAEAVRGTHLEDPAKLCGKIQEDLNREKLAEAFEESAALAREALDHERAGRRDEAICTWRKIFGPDFPEPRGGCRGQGRQTASPEPPMSGLAIRDSVSVPENIEFPYPYPGQDPVPVPPAPWPKPVAKTEGPGIGGAGPDAPAAGGRPRSPGPTPAPAVVRAPPGEPRTAGAPVARNDPRQAEVGRRAQPEITSEAPTKTLADVEEKPTLKTLRKAVDVSRTNVGKAPVKSIGFGARR